MARTCYTLWLVSPRSSCIAEYGGRFQETLPIEEPVANSLSIADGDLRTSILILTDAKEEGDALCQGGHRDIVSRIQCTAAY